MVGHGGLVTKLPECHRAKVARNAASSSVVPGKVPITRSISEECTVARLSVMITESVNSPDRLPLSLEANTLILDGCPPRAMLLVIIATIVWDSSVPS